MSIHIGDVGTIFSVTCLDGSEILDVSTASERIIYFKKPNNGPIIGPFTLSVPGGGTDGIVTYAFAEGDLDAEGNWTYQVYITLESGIKHSDYGAFTVYPNLV
jgi:hypothetical protein